MQPPRKSSPPAPRYEVLHRNCDGRPIQARTWDEQSGFQIVLTFPAVRAAADYERFRARLARTLLGQGGVGE